VARKRDTQSIVGYCIYSLNENKDKRFNNKRMPGLYLLRIGVRIKSQSQGIGRQLMNYLLEEHPLHILTLDVSTDNQRANTFYKSFGL